MYIEKPQSFISTHPFSDVPSFSKYFNPQVRTNKLVNSVVYHPCPSRLASGIHPYFFKLLRVLSLSRMLVELLWLVYSTMCGKNFPVYGVHIRKCVESMHFYSYPESTLTSPGTIFWKSVSPKSQEQRGGWNYDLLY